MSEDFQELHDEARKALEKRAERRRLRESIDLKTILGLVEGRRYLMRLMAKSCSTESSGELIETSFNPNAAAMGYTEGSRRFGILIYNEIMRVSPQSILQMRREYESDLKSDKRDEE